MGIRVLRAGQMLLLTLILTGISSADTLDWSMSVTPQFVEAKSNQTIDFLITFVNHSTSDIFFSDFGDGQGISVDLEGNVVGDGTCAAGNDCFNQNLFLTSPDPIDIPALSPGMTFDLGDLILGNHILGDQITVIVKGGPDSVDGVFPDPDFEEISATVRVTPEPSMTTLLVSAAFASALVSFMRRRQPRYNP